MIWLNKLLIAKISSIEKTSVKKPMKTKFIQIKKMRHNYCHLAIYAIIMRFYNNLGIHAMIIYFPLSLKCTKRLIKYLSS